MYYVYALIDPRDKKPFYIGKGKGNRCLQHEKEALKGSDHPKCIKIREILKQGLSICIERLAYFHDEHKAYDHEKEVISQIGLDNLTNISAGGLINFTKISEAASRDAIALYFWFKAIFVTNGFEKDLVFRFGGQHHKVPNSLIEKMAKIAIQAVETRGIEWCNYHLKKYNIILN